MVFSSTDFLFVFLPLVLGVYFLVRERWRNIVILFASLGFYACGEPKFVLVLVASIVINYLAGVAVGAADGKIVRKRVFLAGAIVLNLGLLFYFKYFNFLGENLNGILTLLGHPTLVFSHVVLPIGISFFTFQGLSYVIDVYRGEVPAQKNFINLAMYKALFPQLIAGPIVRYHDIVGQLEHRTHSVQRFAEGVRRFVLGLGKKVLLANTMGEIADKVFGQSLSGIDTPVAWIGVVAYALQIYFDFSGYSDMAIGLAKMLGFDFKENFDHPYIAQTITEFWRRWHISLTTWFRDYLYIPLGGNRVSKRRLYLNLLIVFCATGIWHGASWTFLVWGLWHGLFMIIERITGLREDTKIPGFIKWAYTMLVVLLGWVLFRSETFGYALGYVATLFGSGGVHDRVVYGVLHYANGKNLLVFIAALFACTPIARKYWLVYAEGTRLQTITTMIWVGLVLFLSVAMLMGATYNPFLYFKF